MLAEGGHYLLYMFAGSSWVPQCECVDLEAQVPERLLLQSTVHCITVGVC